MLSQINVQDGTGGWTVFHFFRVNSCADSSVPVPPVCAAAQHALNKTLFFLSVARFKDPMSTFQHEKAVDTDKIYADNVQRWQNDQNNDCMWLRL